MAGYLANMLGDANNLGFFATPEALTAAYPVGAPGYFAVVGSTNTVWVWNEDLESWIDSGTSGTDAYVYIAYASDDNGTDFSNVFNSALDYIAIKNTTVQIPAPVAADFAGLWKKYKGEKGDTGDSASVNAGTTTTGAPGTSASVTNVGTESNAIFNFTIPEGEKGDPGDTGNGIDNIVKTGTSGLTDTYTITFTDETITTFDVVNGEDGEDGVNAYLYIAYASDDSGAGFTTTFNSALDYIAIKNTTTEIPTPQASDFTGLWKKYKGEKGDNGERGLNWRNEEYSGATTYSVDDALFYNGSSYRCILESTGNLPTNTTYWALIAQKGLDGEGSGDMLASVYDPTGIAGDAFDMDNMVEGTNNKLVSSAEKTAWNDKLDDITGESIADLSDVDSIAGITDGKVLKWSTDKFVIADDNDTTYSAIDFDIKDLTDSTNLRTTWSGKQDALGFTPENATNKKTSLADNSDTYYPSQKAVKTAVDAKQDTLVSGTSIKTINGNSILGSGNLDTPDTTYTASDFDIKDLTDSTSLRDTWSGKQESLGFTPENSANKKTDLTDNSDTYYPSQKAVKTAVDAKQDSLGFTPENVANKVTSFQETPDDTHYPSEKLVKDSLDVKASLTGTETLTNKEVVKRVASTTDDATAIIDSDAYDEYYLTAIASDTEISVTGTPYNGQTILVGLKDAGVSKTLTWTGITGLGQTLPTVTVAGKQHIIGIKYIVSAWRAIAVTVEE